jgi:hypothetical protein
MDNLFVWIVMFAGAAIALLGIFLVASEKELKVKRREIDELLTRLEDGPQQNSISQLVTPQPDNFAELTELRSRNQDLQNQLSALSGKLELSRRTIEELEATQHNANIAHEETRRLRTVNDQLQAKVNELGNRLQAGEARPTGSATDNQDAAEGHARTQSEIMDLKRKLEESQTQLRELESLQQKLANVDALEQRHNEERQRFQSQIAEQERELSIAQEKMRELETLRDRLTESERIQQALREETHRHDEEIVRWRERIAEGEENRRRLASLQAPYDELIAKQAALAERQREFQEELAGFARMIAITAQENPSMSSRSPSPSHRSDDSTRTHDESGPVSGAVFANPLESGTHGRSAVQPHEPAATSPERRTTRRLGIFSAVIVLASLALLASQYLTPHSGESTTPSVIASASRVTDNAPSPATPLSTVNTPPIVNEPPPAPTATSTKETAQRASKEASQAPGPTQLAKQPPRGNGTYEITQPSRVYAAPSELSQLIGEIEPGVKVNVVNTRDGWLEIHSKHGRPPGFIRREVAARVTERN